MEGLSLSGENDAPGHNALADSLTNSLGQRSVLIIDDDKWIHRVISSFLQTYGVNTYSAYDPVEGLAFAINKRPMLIFLDIILPDIKGDMLLRALKKVEVTSHIPVIILSGNLDKNVLGKTYKAGAAGFITKPFSQNVLTEKMIEVLDPEIITRLGITVNSNNLDADFF
jgi:CheY-like chemotaxis protein